MFMIKRKGILKKSDITIHLILMIKNRQSDLACFG